jgi:hypothetical protein
MQINDFNPAYNYVTCSDATGRIEIRHYEGGKAVEPDLVVRSNDTAGALEVNALIAAYGLEGKPVTVANGGRGMMYASKEVFFIRSIALYGLDITLKTMQELGKLG